MLATPQTGQGNLPGVRDLRYVQVKTIIPTPVYYIWIFKDNRTLLMFRDRALATFVQLCQRHLRSFWLPVG